MWRDARSIRADGYRVGLNASEPIEKDGDLFGPTVIMASPSPKAAAGEVSSRSRCAIS